MDPQQPNNTNNDSNPFDQFYQDNDPQNQPPINNETLVVPPPPTQPPTQEVPTVSQTQNPTAPTMPQPPEANNVSSAANSESQSSYVYERADTQSEPIAPSTQAFGSFPTDENEATAYEIEQTSSDPLPDEIVPPAPEAIPESTQTTPQQPNYGSFGPTDVFKAPAYQAPQEVSTPPPAQLQYVPSSAKLKITTKKIFLGLLLFVVMAAIGAIGAVALSSDVNKTILEPLQNLISNVPFLPKNKEFILGRVLSAQENVKSFSYNYSLSLDIESQQFGLQAGSNAAHIDLSAAGVLHQTNDTTQNYSMDLRFKTVLSPYTGELAVKTISTHDALYLQLASITGGLSALSGYLPPLGEWYVVDISTLQTNARETLDDYNQSTPTTVYDSLIEAGKEIAQQTSLQESLQLLEDETLSDGTTAHHLRFVPTPELLASWLATVIEKEQNRLLSAEEIDQLEKVFEGFEDLAADVWIDDETYLLRKLSVTFTYLVDTQSLPPIVTNSHQPLVAGVTKVLSAEDINDSVKGALVMEFGNINSAQPLSIPTQAQPIDDYYNALLDSFSL